MSKLRRENVAAHTSMAQWILIAGVLSTLAACSTRLDNAPVIDRSPSAGISTPTTQLPPFDVTTPYPSEIAGVKFTNYIDWMKSCWYISATGNPAASVPGGFTPEGLPVGVQIVGRNRQDFAVLQLAHAFEEATQFGRRRPPVA